MSSSPGTGRRFGPYEIQSRLGGGGMGHVFRAWDARLHREVAIKLLHDDYAMPGMRERFLREARAASALNHPNICTIFDIGEQDGDPYLVMELMEGETLRDRIARRTLQTDEILCIAKEVAEALGAAHAKGVVHRDVKPANIFLVERPNATVQAKMLDFGLAKIEGGVLGARNARSFDLTTAGSTVGTLAYMSPEQARGEALDSRSDLFSLGVVLYEMATRHVPFPGATSALVFVKLLNEAPEPVRDWNDAVPRDLERIIFKLIAKERTARYQTAQELIEALSHVNEKGGGWLRKAVSTVPLVRAPDPIARQKRANNKKQSVEGYDTLGQDTPTPYPATPQPTPQPTSRPSSNIDSAQVLRPVSRMPRGDNTPRAVKVEQLSTASSSSGTLSTDAATPIPDSATAPALSAAREVSATGPPSTVSARPIDPAVIATGEAFIAPADDLPIAFVEDFSSPDRPTRPIIHYVAAAAVACLLVAVIAAYWLHARGHYGPALLTSTDSLVITEIENRTGNKDLDGAVAQALEFSLSQSPYLQLRSVASYDIVQHQRAVAGDEPNGPIAARELARRLGTHAYLFGTITGQTPPYLLHVDLIDTARGDVLAGAEERASSLGEVPDAVDRVASDLRTVIGETGDSISQNRNTLGREATTNPEALHDFVEGNAAQIAARPLDALRFFQHATKLDPHFIQAHLRLATLYRKFRAGVAAADSSRLALAAADTTSERTRAIAQAEYEMNVSGDLVRATAILRQTLVALPHDAALLEALGRALRLQGKMTESLQASQQAIQEDPYNLDAYAEAENALIGLDRYDAAYQLEGQVEKLGVLRQGIILTAAYLEDRTDVVATASAAFEKPHTGYRSGWDYGIYLENTGRLAEANALWRARAEEAGQFDELESAASFLLAQGALDEALAGECGSALAMARASDDKAQAMKTLYNSGMAHALCGSSERAAEIVEELLKGYPQSFAVSGFYVPDLKAAMALHDRDPAAALEILKPARQYDLLSLTPYLRGMAHVALRQVQIGIVDYQTVLAHRGVTFLVGNNVYPIAEIGVARAFADTGDKGNSAEAYRRFLELWRNADPGQPLVAEARAHAK